MANLQRALEIAVESHKNQKQKDGSPYAFHPIRLSLSLETEEQKIVALLHDVVEAGYATAIAPAPAPLAGVIRPWKAGRGSITSDEFDIFQG